MKWEYKQIEVTYSNRNNVNLTSFGYAGWELVSVVEVGGYLRYFFKRQYGN